MKHFHFFYVLLMISVLLSCNSDDNDRRMTDGDYLPLQKGLFQIYDVKEIVYTLSKPETLAYELKMIVADSFANAEENYTYVLRLSKRTMEDEAWQNVTTWSVRKNNREIVRTEATVPYLIMMLPIQLLRPWDGNLYNSEVNPGTNLPEDYYEVIEKGKTMEINGNTFNDCVVVRQEDNQEFIVFNDKRTEIYCRGIGLVFKERIQLKYCNDQDRNCIGQQQIDEGIIFRQEIKGYGRE